MKYACYIYDKGSRRVMIALTKEELEALDKIPEAFVVSNGLDNTVRFQGGPHGTIKRRTAKHDGSLPYDGMTTLPLPNCGARRIDPEIEGSVVTIPRLAGDLVHHRPRVPRPPKTGWTLKDLQQAIEHVRQIADELELDLQLKNGECVLTFRR
jgi:hypothetical protein